MVWAARRGLSEARSPRPTRPPRRRPRTREALLRGRTSFAYASAAFGGAAFRSRMRVCGEGGLRLIRKNRKTAPYETFCGYANQAITSTYLLQSDPRRSMYCFVGPRGEKNVNQATDN